MLEVLLATDLFICFTPVGVWYLQPNHAEPISSKRHWRLSVKRDVGETFPAVQGQSSEVFPQRTMCGFAHSYPVSGHTAGHTFTYAPDRRSGCFEQTHSKQQACFPAPAARHTCPTASVWETCHTATAAVATITYSKFVGHQPHGGRRCQHSHLKTHC